MPLFLFYPSSGDDSPSLLRQGFGQLPVSTLLWSWLPRSSRSSESFYSGEVTPLTAAVAAQIHAWFHGLDGGDLADKVMCMAWQFRGAVITVTTSPCGGGDERSPALKVTPLCTWEAEKSLLALEGVPRAAQLSAAASFRR